MCCRSEAPVPPCFEIHFPNTTPHLLSLLLDSPQAFETRRFLIHQSRSRPATLFFFSTPIPSNLCPRTYRLVSSAPLCSCICDATAKKTFHIHALFHPRPYNANHRQSHQPHQQSHRKPQQTQLSVEAGLATTKLALVLPTPKKNRKPTPTTPKNLPSFQLEPAPLATAVGEMAHATQTPAPLILVMMATAACGRNPSA
jgi:hypothetical protein